MAGGTTHVVTAPLVTVRDRTGRIHYVATGRPITVDAPAEELKRLRDKGLIRKAKAGEFDAEPAAPETFAGLPAKSANREAWEAYAVVVGVDPADEQFKGDKPALVDAVTKAHEAKDAGSDSEGDGSGS